MKITNISSIGIRRDYMSLFHDKLAYSAGRQTGKFLRGPVPWRYLTRAAALPGKCLHLAVILWQRRGQERVNTVTLSSRAAREFGVKWQSARRALRNLEGAGLVRVHRTAGKAPRVEILVGKGGDPQAVEIPNE